MIHGVTMKITDSFLLRERKKLDSSVLLQHLLRYFIEIQYSSLFRCFLFVLHWYETLHLFSCLQYTQIRESCIVTVILADNRKLQKVCACMLGQYNDHEKCTDTSRIF